MRGKHGGPGDRKCTSSTVSARQGVAMSLHLHHTVILHATIQTFQHLRLPAGLCAHVFPLFVFCCSRLTIHQSTLCLTQDLRTCGPNCKMQPLTLDIPMILARTACSSTVSARKEGPETVYSLVTAFCVHAFLQACSAHILSAKGLRKEVPCIVIKHAIW